MWKPYAGGTFGMESMISSSQAVSGDPALSKPPPVYPKIDCDLPSESGGLLINYSPIKKISLFVNR